MPSPNNLPIDPTVPQSTWDNLKKTLDEMLADTQLEAQTAATMALDQLRGYSGFFEWYAGSRAGKNMLAP